MKTTQIRTTPDLGNRNSTEVPQEYKAEMLPTWQRLVQLMELTIKQFQSHYRHEHILSRIKEKEQIPKFCFMPLQNRFHNMQASVYKNVIYSYINDFNISFSPCITHLQYITTV